MTKKNLVKFLTLLLVSTFVFALSSDVSAQKKPKKKARKLAKQADTFFNEGKYDEAIVKYGEALNVSPIFPKAHFFKGSSHYRQKQYDQAINELTTALQQGSEPEKIYPLRMESYAENGNFKAALDDAQKVIELNPNDAYYSGFLGRMLILNREFNKGIPHLENAVNAGTRDPNVFYYLAIGYNSLGDYEKQERSADMALERGTPFSANAWYLSADAAYRNRKYQKAAQSYKNAINAYKNLIETKRSTNETEQNIYQSYVSLADTYRNLNLFDEAIRAAKDGLILRTSDPALHISLTWYYSLAGNRGFAIAAGERAVDIAPDQYMAYTNLCRAYNGEAEYVHKKTEFNSARVLFRQAIKNCKKALEMEPNDGETNYYLGRTYFYLDNDALSKSYYRKSVNGLKRFTENNPEYSDGYYLLGNAYFATEDKVNAIKAYKECLRIAPRFALVRYNLGFVYFKNGDKTAALEQHEVLKTLDEDLAKRLLNVIN